MIEQMQNDSQSDTMAVQNDWVNMLEQMQRDVEEYETAFNQNVRK